MANAPVHFLAFNGPWQLIVACAAIRRRHGELEDASRWKLLLTGATRGSRLHQLLLRLCEAYFPGGEVLDLTALGDIRARDDLIAFVVARRLEAGEVWLAYPGTTIAGTLHLLFPQASFQVFEEGLHSYTQDFAMESDAPRGALARQILGPRVRRGDFEQLRRLSGFAYRKSLNALMKSAPPVDCFHGILTETVPPAVGQGVAVSAIPQALIREEIDRYARFAGAETPVYREPTILVLGDNLLWPLRLHYQEVLELTVELFRSMIDSGYQVVWKPHPRMPAFCSDYLVLKVASSRLIWEPQADLVPAEVAYGGSGLSGVASLMSSCLLYFPLLYDIPGYCLPAVEGFSILKPGLQEVRRICERNAEPWSALGTPLSHS
ncbi:MAG: hypothetical protein E1N59_3079 [Puniceicoccaceae bacterium 5H]|nr:MAG: hypothetical protein E1N59_3079 [Puniceicoccaceae bacterium 5H]